MLQTSHLLVFCWQFLEQFPLVSSYLHLEIERFTQSLYINSYFQIRDDEQY